MSHMPMGAGGSRPWRSSLLLAVATATTRRRSYFRSRETHARGELYLFRGSLAEATRDSHAAAAKHCADACFEAVYDHRFQEKIVSAGFQ